MHVYGPGNIAQIRDMSLPYPSEERIFQVPSKDSEPNVKKWFREMDKTSKIRANRVNRIRQQIEAGEYDLESKLPLAVDQLLDDLLSSE